MVKKQSIFFFGEPDIEVFPELILLDINMPIMDGFDFMKKFGELNLKGKDNIHMIVLTTTASAEDIERMKDLGVSQFLDKPLSEEKLKEALKNIAKS